MSLVLGERINPTLDEQGAKVVSLHQGRHTLTMYPLNHNGQPIYQCYGEVKNTNSTVVAEINSSRHYFGYVSFTTQGNDYLLVSTKDHAHHLINLTKNRVTPFPSNLSYIVSGTSNQDGSIVAVAGWLGGGYELNYLFYRITPSDTEDHIREITGAYWEHHQLEVAPGTLDVEGKPDVGDDTQDRFEWFTDDTERQCVKLTYLERYFPDVNGNEFHHSSMQLICDQAIEERYIKEGKPVPSKMDIIPESVDLFYQLPSEMRPDESITYRLSDDGNSWVQVDRWYSDGYKKRRGN